VVLNQEETSPTPGAMRGLTRRQRRSAKRKSINGRMVAVDAPLHGEPGTYNNWVCRCAKCTTANNAAAKVSRRARWDRTVRNGGIAPGDVAHGRSATYYNWGCQCRPCLDAACAARLKSGASNTT